MTSDAVEPTPAELRLVASSVERLAVEIDALRARFTGSPDTIRRTGFRLYDLVGELRGAVVRLGDTASDLARASSARDRSLCPAKWGACPAHGGSLTSSGGRSWCTVCDRSWDYDRLNLTCGQPVTHLAIDAHGDGHPMCAGHAIAAGGEMPGWTSQPLAGGEADS